MIHHTAVSFNGALSASPNPEWGLDARSILLVKNESSHSSVLMGLYLLAKLVKWGLCLLAQACFNGTLSASPQP